MWTRMRIPRGGARRPRARGSASARPGRGSQLRQAAHGARAAQCHSGSRRRRFRTTLTSVPRRKRRDCCFLGAEGEVARPLPASHPARRRMKGRRPGSRPATDTHAARTGGDIRSHGTRAHRDPSPFQSYVISPIANLLGGGRGSHAAPRRDMGPDIPAHESENAHMLSGDENGVTEEDMLTLQGFAGAKRLAQIARANGDTAVNIDADSSNDGSSASGFTRRRRAPAPTAARFEAKLERKYEQNPFVVWLGMLRQGGRIRAGHRRARPRRGALPGLLPHPSPGAGLHRPQPLQRRVPRLHDTSGTMAPPAVGEGHERKKIRALAGRCAHPRSPRPRSCRSRSSGTTTPTCS